jgi:hypothetical protein
MQVLKSGTICRHDRPAASRAVIAGLFCRLDNDVGTGVHLTPTGIEFDERRLTLGKSTEVSFHARH